MIPSASFHVDCNVLTWEAVQQTESASKESNLLAWLAAVVTAHSHGQEDTVR